MQVGGKTTVLAISVLIRRWSRLAGLCPSAVVDLIHHFFVTMLVEIDPTNDDVSIYIRRPNGQKPLPYRARGRQVHKPWIDTTWMEGMITR